MLVQPLGLAPAGIAIAGAGQFTGHLEVERLDYRDIPGAGTGGGPGRALAAVLRRTPFDCGGYAAAMAAFSAAVSPRVGEPAAQPSLSPERLTDADTQAVAMLAGAVHRARTAFKLRLIGAGLSIEALARRAGLSALRAMQSAAGAHEWWVSACTAAAPFPRPVPEVSGNCSPVLGASTVQVVNTFVILPKADIRAVAASLEASGAGDIASYINTQAVIAQRVAAHDNSEEVCVASVVDSGLVELSCELPPASVASRILMAAESAHISARVEVLEFYSAAFAPDYSDRVRLEAEAEALAGLLQMTQGSAFAAGERGWGAHKQLGARKGARARRV